MVAFNAHIAIQGDTAMSSVHAFRTPAASLRHAALIDEHGQEIPITESMILQACETLERHWHYPPPARREASPALRTVRIAV
ncbi:PA1571 family protein [Alloalcanivorax mobilis]|uniref:PA1571 family protein n=1 Tax=Alloalcanivorax mobilis TaxID=2019569 RepID=UPI002FCDD41D